MKRSFLDFNKVHYFQKRTGFAPELRTRHNKGAQFRTGGGEGGEDDEDDEEEDPSKKESKMLARRISSMVKKQLEGRATKQEVEAIANKLVFLTKGKNDKGEEIDAPFPIEQLRAMADEKTGVMAKMVEMGVALQKFESEQANAPKDMSIRSQVAAWQEKNKETLKKIAEGQKIDVPAMELRLASPMLVSTVNAGSSPYIGSTQVEAGINDFIRLPNTFWDFLTKGRTSAATYVWVNKTNPLGAAAFIGPGVAKPGVSFELEAESSVAKKIADSAKAGTELLQDIDGMTSFIEQELREQVMIKVNATLMSHAGSSTIPKGIQNYSVAYTLTTIKTTNPTFVDCLRAIVGQLRSGAITGPIDMFINSIDAANMDIAKASDSGVYLLPPFVTANGMQVAGARIREDNNVPVGYVQAGFMRFYRVLIYKDFTVTWGWENDDFTKNLVTAVGEMRLHQFVNSIYADSGVFVYDSFENVKTAITEA